MKTLIAIVNARPRQQWREALRKTWLPLVPKDKADAFFFVGRGEPCELGPDVVELDCDDSYWGLPDKVRAIARWALANGYDFMLKCDDDVALIPRLLLASGYNRQPYTGRANRKPTRNNPFYIPVGFNYWLSRACMECIKNEETPQAHNDDELWVATILHENGIHLTDDRRYRLHTGEFITRPKRRPLRPKRPPSVHAEWVEGEFSWCVYLESGMINNIPVEDKIKQYEEVYEKYCVPYSEGHNAQNPDSNNYS